VPGAQRPARGERAAVARGGGSGPRRAVMGDCAP
jgi:hypothetical protein